MTSQSLASSYLRKARSRLEILDFIPTEQYAEADAVRAIDDANFVVLAAARIITELSRDAPRGTA